MINPALARPSPLSDGLRRIACRAQCPQMIPGSQPTQMSSDEMEQINDATASPEVCVTFGANAPGCFGCAGWGTAGGAGGADCVGGTGGGPIGRGTVMVALQDGQAISAPWCSVSHKIF